MQFRKNYFHRIEAKIELRLKFTLKEFTFSQIVSLGFLQLGFGIGFSSPTLSELQKLGLLDENTYPIFTSLFVIGLTLGPLLSIVGSKYLGRKLVSILTSLSTTFGLILIAVATNAGYLLAGRLFHGIGVGILIAIIPVYIGEIAPSTARGFLSSFEGVYDVLGSLFVYTFGIFLSFRWLAILGVAMSMLYTIALLIVPQSATWLYSRGLEKRAKCVLEGLRRKEENVLDECRAIRTALEIRTETTMSISYYLKLVLVKYRMKALAVGILLALGLVNTGIDIVFSYTSPLLENAKGIDPNIVAIGVPIFGLFGAVLVIFLVEPCGRKSLLFVSAIIVIGSLISIACYFIVNEHILGCAITAMHIQNGSFVDFDVCDWIVFWPGVSLSVFSFGFQIGWGSILYIIIGELFPIRIKEFGSGIFNCVMSLYSILTLTMFPYISSAIGNGYTFLIFGLINIITLPCIVAFLPETKSLKADEIEVIFQKKSIFCGINCTTNSPTIQD